MGEITEEAIRERAYHIWQREGCPHGRDFEHWVQAQIELAALGKGNGGATAAAPRTPKAAGSAASKTAASKAVASKVVASKTAVVPASAKRAKKLA